MHTVDFGLLFHKAYNNIHNTSYTIEELFDLVYYEYFITNNHYYEKNTFIHNKSSLPEFKEELKLAFENNTVSNTELLGYGAKVIVKHKKSYQINNTSFSMLSTKDFDKNEALVSWFGRLVSLQIEGIDIFVKNIKLAELMVLSNEYYNKILNDVSINLLKDKQISRFNIAFLCYVVDKNIPTNCLLNCAMYNDFVDYIVQEKFLIDDTKKGSNKQLNTPITFITLFNSISKYICEDVLTFFSIAYSQTNSTFGHNTIDFSDTNGNLGKVIKKGLNFKGHFQLEHLKSLGVSFKTALELPHITIDYIVRWVKSELKTEKAFKKIPIDYYENMFLYNDKKIKKYYDDVIFYLLEYVREYPSIKSKLEKILKNDLLSAQKKLSSNQIKQEYKVTEEHRLFKKSLERWNEQESEDKTILNKVLTKKISNILK